MKIPQLTLSPKVKKEILFLLKGVGVFSGVVVGGGSVLWFLKNYTVLFVAICVLVGGWMIGHIFFDKDL